MFHSVPLPCYSCTMCSLAPPTFLEFKWCTICTRRTPSRTARVQLCSVLLGVHNIVRKALTHDVVIDTILPTRDWKHASLRGQSVSKDGVISKQSTSLLEVPFSLEPSFVAQENRYRHARQDIDHIGWSVNFCMQSNFNA